MVGSLNLHNVCDDDPLEMRSKADRALDSPDSGLPPSPCPSVWTTTTTEEEEDPEHTAASVKSVSQLQALWYGEGIELDPRPLQEMRYTSSLRYDSERHFIQDVSLQPTALSLETCSTTVVTLPQSSWRRYRTRLDFQPRQRVQRYRSTTIIYPKHTRTFYTTQLSYQPHNLSRRFFSTVELQASPLRRGRGLK